MASILTRTENIYHIADIFNKTLLASVLAADGLANNSIVSLIPAMLISPIGSMIMKMALGSKRMFLEYLVILIIMLIIAVICGFFYVKLYMKMFPDKELPSKEMIDRTEPNNIITNVIIAIICALSFNMAMKNNDIPTLIAIGIATSLLPPITNIGCMLACDNDIIKNKQNYIVSFGIFLVNFVILYLGISLFKDGVNNINAIIINIGLIL